MRVHLIKEKTLRAYWKHNPQSVASLIEWVSRIKQADWKLPGDILNDFRTADLLGRGSSRVVFNIGGNRYRLICKYIFQKSEMRLYIVWIGTHNEYTTLCAANNQFTISDY
jgi:mRNA interferase HigB